MSDADYTIIKLKEDMSLKIFYQIGNLLNKKYKFAASGFEIKIENALTESELDKLQNIDKYIESIYSHKAKKN